MFEVHLRNTTKKRQQGTLVFSFPGPSQVEAQFSPDAPLKKINISFTWTAWVPEASSPVEAHRQDIEEQGLKGVMVSSDAGMSYVLGAIGTGPIRLGSGLNADDWARIETGLPQLKPTDFSSSLAVDFDLTAGEEKTIHIVLAWYQPVWFGGSQTGGDRQAFYQMYSSRFGNATEVARLFVREHGSLLRRILSWQEAIYTNSKLPPWLGDVLVNSLATIPETSFWSMGKGVLEWCGPEGFFAQMESARRVPGPATLPCDFYGNLPIVYFFSDLAKNQLRMYAHNIRTDGAAPIGLPLTGQCEDGAYNIHVAMNGVCFVDLVDRIWQHTGDDSVLSEYYPAVKRSTIFTMSRNPGPEGIISVAGIGWGGQCEDWWEHYCFFGMTPHVGGMHLANLLIAKRMALKMGDTEFAHQCQTWFEQGSKAMEEYLWNGQYYLLYNDPANNRKSDTIMACALDGEWATRFHGLSGVFRPDRLKKHLKVVKEKCLDEVVGAYPFVTPDGNPTLRMMPLEHHSVVPYAIFPAETNILAMTYLYAGEMVTGREVLKNNWYNMVCRHPHAWDLPNFFRPYTGRTAMGTEYYQNLTVWAVPAAIEGKDLTGPCQPGGLVDRVLKAAREKYT